MKSVNLFASSKSGASVTLTLSGVNVTVANG